MFIVFHNSPSQAWKQARNQHLWVGSDSSCDLGHHTQCPCFPRVKKFRGSRSQRSSRPEQRKAHSVDKRLPRKGFCNLHLGLSHRLIFQSSHALLILWAYPLCPWVIDNSQETPTNRALCVDSSVYAALYKWKGSGQDTRWLIAGRC